MNECIVALCLYFGGAFGIQDTSRHNMFIEQGGDAIPIREYVDGSSLAKAYAGVQVKDWFSVELEHISNPRSHHDIGVNAVWIKKIWSFEVTE